MIKCKMNEIPQNMHEGVNEIELTDYMVKLKFELVKK